MPLNFVSGNKGVTTLLDPVVRSKIGPISLKEIRDKRMESEHPQKLHEPPKNMNFDTKMEELDFENYPR